MELVAGSLVSTLVSSAFREIASTYEVDSEIQRLKESVEGIKARLAGVHADVDHKKYTDQLIHWVRDLTQALYKADDFLDQLRTQHLLRVRDGQGKVRDFFSSSNPIIFHHKIARFRNIIRVQLNEFAENMPKLNLDNSVLGMEHENRNWRETRPLLPQEDIVGREGNKEDIIHLLLNDNNSNQNVSMVAIVGIGGLGKTALAQLVYNDARVELFFHKRMWVCVSQDFNVIALFKKLLESLIDNYVDDQQLELILNKLEENLNGQRYLLVLDDVWNSEKLLSLEQYLMRGARGSKILVTTRNQMIAKKMGVETTYVLKGLTNDQSWTLLKRLAFDNDNIMPQSLESIGQKIAEKCAGVPLAINVMGSLLRGRRDWEAILKGHFWEICEDNKSIMPILRLSYDHLPIELQQCFAYFSLYPKDWIHEKDELIDLWMAQGFLEIKNKNQCLEDIGEEYVYILLMNSFLQDVQTNELGEIKHFKMHDLMNDLSLSIACSNYALYVEGRKNVARRPIHASFEEYNPNTSINMMDLGQLRTFLEVKKKYQRNSSDLFMFKRLRSLDLSCYKMRDLPSIGNVSHLRYLNLSNCYELTCLPKSMTNLVNLQTLKLNWCGNLKFPGEIITKLINLRLLDIQGCKAFEDGMPIGLGKMTSLQSLSHFIVGKERKKAQLNELKELNLRGGLTIQYLGSIWDVEGESKDVNLRTKENLISLTLKWGLYSEMKSNDAMQLLENLHPHQNLKALTIEDYPGVRLSDWLLSCTNLVELKFIDIRNCQYMVALEGLISLKTLHIQSMDKLKYIYYKECSSSTNFFASLEELKIQRCKSLKGWETEANVQNTTDNEEDHPLPPFSRLSSLQINCCPNLSRIPPFPNLVRCLELAYSSTKPLLDTLKVSTVGPSTSTYMAASLSKLKSLHIEGINIEALPDEWMQNLSSLKHLSIASFSSPEKPFLHMRNLSATLEKFTIRYLHSWNGDEDYNTQCQDLHCLHSLQTIVVTSCDHLMALPEWICGLQSLRFISIQFCDNLKSFPEAEWPKIAHIPNKWIDLHRI